MTDQEIRAVFEGASDFEARTLKARDCTLYGYFIDGLVSSSFIADYIYKPISLDLPQKSFKVRAQAAYGEKYFNYLEREE